MLLKSVNYRFDEPKREFRMLNYSFSILSDGLDKKQMLEELESKFSILEELIEEELGDFKKEKTGKASNSNISQGYSYQFESKNENKFTLHLSYKIDRLRFSKDPVSVSIYHETYGERDLLPLHDKITALEGVTIFPKTKKTLDEIESLRNGVDLKELYLND